MTLSEIIKKIMDNPGDSFWVRVLKRYHMAQCSRAVREMGVTGVGLITFAENRAALFVMRCGR